MKNKMKKWGLVLVFANAFANAQEPLKPYVDERVELLSTVFRLADAQEYSSNNNALYVEDINKDFGKFKGNDFFELLKKNRNKSGIGYDAVMFAAVNLDIKNGNISLIDAQKNNFDRRWTKEYLPVFLKGLNQFYKESNFHDFYTKHEEDYQQAAKAFSDSVMVKFNQKWYPQFYGKQPNEDYKIVIGYGNGGGNYGPRVAVPNHNDIVYAIVSGGSFDGRKMKYSSNYASTLIHEFNHSFVNYILDTKDYKAQLEDSGKKILAAVKEKMSEQAYKNWETIINESIVRAAVIVYMKENNFSEEEIAAEYKEQRDREFLWINDLVAALETYEANRDEYPNLESFYPNLVTFFKLTALNIDKTVKEYHDKLPKVKSLSVDINGKQNVDSNLKEVIIYFDRPLIGTGMSINLGSLGKDGIPISKRPVYTDDNKALKVELSMKPNTEYEFILTGSKFQSLDGYPLEEYTIKFKTK